MFWIILGVFLQIITYTKLPSNHIKAAAAIILAGPLYSICNVAGCCDCEY